MKIPKDQHKLIALEKTLDLWRSQLKRALSLTLKGLPEEQAEYIRKRHTRTWSSQEIVQFDEALSSQLWQTLSDFSYHDGIDDSLENLLHLFHAYFDPLLSLHYVQLSLKETTTKQWNITILEKQQEGTKIIQKHVAYDQLKPARNLVFSRDTQENSTMPDSLTLPLYEENSFCGTLGLSSSRTVNWHTIPENFYQQLGKMILLKLKKHLSSTTKREQSLYLRQTLDSLYQTLISRCKEQGIHLSFSLSEDLEKHPCCYILEDLQEWLLMIATDALEKTRNPFIHLYFFKENEHLIVSSIVTEPLQIANVSLKAYLNQRPGIVTIEKTNGTLHLRVPFIPQS